MPRKYPITGINAWNPPNHRAVAAECLGFSVRTERPLQIDTAKASIDTPTAIMNSSDRCIAELHVYVKASYLQSPLSVLNDHNILTIKIFNKNLVFKFGV